MPVRTDRQRSHGARQKIDLREFRKDAVRLLGADHAAVLMLRPFGDEISREDLRVLLPSLLAVLEAE
jgi:hypothetical protein